MYRRIRAGIFGAAALALLFCVNLVSAKDLAVSVDELVDYFDTIVFGSELDARFANTVIAKWQKPRLTVSIEQKATEEHLKMIQHHLDALSALTRIKFGGTKSPETADIRILFLSTAQMGAIQGPNIDPEVVRLAAANANCYFLSWKQPPSRIVKALIAVDMTKDIAVLNSCLLEELTQSLGLPNDSDALRPSIFSDRDRLYDLGPQDRVLLYALYHPRMKAGLPREEALEVAREIFNGLTTPAEPSTSRGPNG